MTILKDIKEIVDEFKSDYNEVHARMGISGKGSIARAAKSGVLQFPLLVTTAASLEETTMAMKCFERMQVSFVRIVTSLNAITDAKDVESYLKRLHQNFEVDNAYSTRMVKNSVDMFYDLTESLNNLHEMNLNLLEESEFVTYELTDFNAIQAWNIVNAYKKICEGSGLNIIRRGGSLFAVKDNFVAECIVISEGDNYSLTMTPLFDVNNINFTKPEVQEVINENMNLLEEYKSPFNMDILNEKTSSSKPKIVNNVHTGFVRGSVDHFGTTNNNVRMSIENQKKAFVTKNDTVNTIGGGVDVNVHYDKDESPKVINTVLKDNLTDNDVKKANEMVPSMLHIVTHFKDPDGTKILKTQDYLIGVKATVHPISSESMVENIARGIKKDRKFFNFVKFTSGEISFFKDFVFTIRDIKAEVKSKHSDSKWWSALLRRKNRSKFNFLEKFTDSKISSVLPNASIIVTIDEVDVIKNKYNIDLLKVKTAQELMNTYYLLGFAILDPATETIRTLFDGDADYNTLSYTALERENSNQAREVKNIMQVLGKM